MISYYVLPVALSIPLSSQLTQQFAYITEKTNKIPIIHLSDTQHWITQEFFCHYLNCSFKLIYPVNKIPWWTYIIQYRLKLYWLSEKQIIQLFVSLLHFMSSSDTTTSTWMPFYHLLPMPPALPLAFLLPLHSIWEEDSKPPWTSGKNICLLGKLFSFL